MRAKPRAWCEYTSSSFDGGPQPGRRANRTGTRARIPRGRLRGWSAGHAVVVAAPGDDVALDHVLGALVREVDAVLALEIVDVDVGDLE